MSETDSQARSDWVLLKQGAEARVYSCQFFDKSAIVKERFVKTYRLPELDKKLTNRSPQQTCIYSRLMQLYTMTVHASTS